MLNTYFDKIFWINCNTRADRYLRMQARLKLLGVEAERVECVRGAKVQIPIPLISTRTLNAGEVGCFLSHRMLYQRIQKEGWQRTLILEDDAEFVKGFAERFEDVYEAVPTDWQMLYLGRWNYDYLVTKERGQNGERVGLNTLLDEKHGHGIYAADRNWLTHAYAVDQSAIEHILTHTSEIKGGIDEVLAQIQSELKVYAIHPALIHQDNSRSSIR